MFSTGTALAAPETPAGYPPNLAALESGKLPQAPIDYISPDAVTLTDREKKALQLSDDWARRNVEPVLTPGGKIVYVHGATLPSIVAVPYQVCDVELEQGETVNEVVVGDSARWLVDSGTSGSGASATVHLFVKPMDAGLETSAVVTTDRRVYHLRFVSKRTGHTPYVGFAYADSIRQKQAWKQQQDAKAREWQTGAIDGETVDLSALNFAYGSRARPAGSRNGSMTTAGRSLSGCPPAPSPAKCRCCWCARASRTCL